MRTISGNAPDREEDIGTPRLKDLEALFHKTDFSGETDLEKHLAARLFGARGDKVPFPFERITPKDAQQVSAAKGIPGSGLPQNILYHVENRTIAKGVLYGITGETE